MIGEASAGPPPGGGRVATGVPRLRWLVVMILAAAAFAVIASRPNPPVTHPPTGEVAKVQQAIEDQLDPGSGRDPLAALPADFTTVSGRHPIHLKAPDGTVRAVHPGGGCSSPWGDTRWDYSVGCKAHDLGYDMLRYADRKGQPLSPELRERLDDRLSKDMHAQCTLNPRGSPAACEVVASFYTVGLVVNSWHQRWGPPQNEPVGPWSVAMVVILLLIAVRAPAVVRRGVRHKPRRAPTQPRLDPTEQAQTDYLGFLRIVSLTGIVLAESMLAFTMRGAAEAGWLWPLTWLLQLVPLFFLAGGHANLLAWRAARDAGAGYGTYLVGRIGWLIRPTLAFVIAWLVVPLSLELLQAPDDAITAFSRLIVQPLWLLGLYLLVVAVTPVMHRLHLRLPYSTPLALLAGVVALSFFGGSVAAHAGGVLVALLFGQLAFHYADGTLWRLPRWALVAGAAVAFAGLVALTTLGAQPKLQLAEPTGYAAFAPSLAGVLLIGLVQVCLVALPREPGLRAVATSPPARAMDVVRAAPMTVYLVYLLAMLLLEGLVGVARSAGVAAGGIDWLIRPRTMLALGLIAMPTLLSFLWFERRGQAAPEPELVEVTEDEPRTWTDTAAAALGVAFGALGVLGFAVTGLSGWTQTSALLGLPIDPMANLIHLLAGWYLVHCVHLQTSSRPSPWLVTAIACVPPMITTVSGVGTIVHGGIMVGALAVAVVCAQPSRARQPGARPVPVGGRPSG
ncbi:phospholipase A2 [Actinophytocola sp.]|uniref:phospholipase A2 n=1 Tax=Actinophytocola sp. TaxID=1872138 RepID=UPI002ED93858